MDTHVLPNGSIPPTTYEAFLTTTKVSLNLMKPLDLTISL